MLSVVVTIVDGGATLRRFLDALTGQQDPPPMQLLVPYDASVAAAGELSSLYPQATFLDLGVVRTERPLHSAAGQHELYDRRRAAGLAAATGSLVAILEDRGAPRADWARTVVRLHEQPAAVIGGAIEHAPGGGVLGWAVHVCDFGRYALPFEGGPVRWVSDVNVSYKRPALEATRELWRDRFHEPLVHWALLERGETLLLSPELVVEHRQPPRTLGALLRERFHWGRLFGRIHATRLRTPQRLARAAAAPLLPFVLLARHGRTQHGKGRLGRFLLASPAIALLLVAWSGGEGWGYLTRRG